MSAASIEGEAFMLQELFERWSYDIDYYQREFAWSADDVRTLVDDLVTQFQLAKTGPVHTYLLARITAFTQTGWNELDLTVEYLSPDRSWHIEHIFADKPERHPDITDPVA